MSSRTYSLVPTTQGPLYPPSEALDADGNFVVVGKLNRADALGAAAPWGAAIVAPDPAPAFGTHEPYRILEELDLDDEDRLARIELYTLPLPLPSNNYPMRFAPEQLSRPERVTRASHPLHAVPYPDERPIDGPRRVPPITLGQWLRATGTLTVTVAPEGTEATFALEMTGLLPDSLYTVMTLRSWDLRPHEPTRPGPLGIPNVLVTTPDGAGRYRATLPNPFPTDGNRVINVILLWMSEQRSYAGAIGQFGLGGDVHAQLKLPAPAFHDLSTHERKA